MAQFVLSKTMMGPMRVSLRTQSRSMAAAPLIARVSRQSRAARCVTRAAADTVQVRSNDAVQHSPSRTRSLRELLFLLHQVSANTYTGCWRCVVCVELRGKGSLVSGAAWYLHIA